MCAVAYVGRSGSNFECWFLPSILFIRQDLSWLSLGGYPRIFPHELTRGSPFPSASPSHHRCAVITDAHCIWPFHGFYESELRSSGLH